MGKKTVLLLSGNDKSFLTNSMCENLGKNNITVYNTTLSDENVESYVNTSDLMIIMEGVELELYGARLNLLKDIFYAQMKKVVIYSNPEPIEKMKRIFPDSMIAEVYIRPMDANQVVEKIVCLLSGAAQAKEKKKVLVVDDSGPMLRTIMGWLEGTYQVSLANSAASAFSSIEKSKPDLILLDYEMPVCSGAQFLQMLRQEETTKQIPVIFLTSVDDAETVKKVIELKPEGYILKTTPEARVKEIVAQFFAK